MPRRPKGPGSPELRASAAGVLVALAIGLTWVWPAFGRGQLLYRDFVQVPDPALGASALGASGQAPRAVPLDAVTALLAVVIPTGVQQQAMLLASIVLAGAGVAVLMRRHGVAASITGAALASWSPYAAQRLLLGQPPTLLGWAMVPWLVTAVRLDVSWRSRLVAVALAALPAAVTPFGGLLALGTVVVAALTARPHRTRREIGALAGLSVLWCLPWVVAGLRGDSAAGETAGAWAFAVAGSGVRGVLDVLGGGGVWAPAATLASRAGPSALVASLVLLIVALATLVAPGRHLDRWAAPDGAAVRSALALTLVLPPSLALALATPVGLAVWGPAQQLPGVGILRDTHRLLGVSTLAVAVLAALAVEALAATARRGWAPAGRLAATGAACSALALAVLTSPDIPGRLHRAYHPVRYPVGWAEAVAQIGDRTTLVLPWQPFRRQSWVGDQPFLDPLPLALPGRVLSSRDLTVSRSGQISRVGSDDHRAADAWARSDLATLRRLGVEAVVTWTDTPGAADLAPPGARRMSAAGPLTVWLIDGPDAREAPRTTSTK